jgi:hypothetical protein
MRSYLIDEISSADMEGILSFLRKKALRSSLDRIFWIQLPDELLTDMQSAHHDCQPHVFAIELGLDWVKLEMFIRSLKNLQCSCPGYCDTEQSNFVLGFAQTMILETGIRT